MCLSPAEHRWKFVENPSSILSRNSKDITRHIIHADPLGNAKSDKDSSEADIGDKERVVVHQIVVKKVVGSSSVEISGHKTFAEIFRVPRERNVGVIVDSHPSRLLIETGDALYKASSNVHDFLVVVCSFGLSVIVQSSPMQLVAPSKKATCLL